MWDNLVRIPTLFIGANSANRGDHEKKITWNKINYSPDATFVYQIFNIDDVWPLVLPFNKKIRIFKQRILKY